MRSNNKYLRSVSAELAAGASLVGITLTMSLLVALILIRILVPVLGPVTIDGFRSLFLSLLCVIGVSMFVAGRMAAARALRADRRPVASDPVVSDKATAFDSAA